MKDLNLTLFGEAASELGTTYAVVSGLVKSLGIEPKPVPHVARGKGLDRNDMAQLRRAMGQTRRRAKASASVQAR